MSSCSNKWTYCNISSVIGLSWLNVCCRRYVGVWPKDESDCDDSHWSEPSEIVRCDIANVLRGTGGFKLNFTRLVYEKNHATDSGIGPKHMKQALSQACLRGGKVGLEESYDSVQFSFMYFEIPLHTIYQLQYYITICDIMTTKKIEILTYSELQEGEFLSRRGTSSVARLIEFGTKSESLSHAYCITIK